MLNKFSAQSGCETRSFSVFTPIDSTSEKSNAFSTSRYAQYPANRTNRNSLNNERIQQEQRHDCRRYRKSLTAWLIARKKQVNYLHENDLAKMKIRMPNRYLQAFELVLWLEVQVLSCQLLLVHKFPQFCPEIFKSIFTKGIHTMIENWALAGSS